MARRDIETAKPRDEMTQLVITLLAPCLQPDND
jgi:hypothetical protein